MKARRFGVEAAVELGQSRKHQFAGVRAFHT